MTRLTRAGTRVQGATGGLLPARRRAWRTNALVKGVCAGVGTAALLVALAGGPVTPPARADSDASADAGPAGTGTVETIIGPGVCPGAGTIDEASREVRSVAVDRTGVTFVDTGLAELGQVARIDQTGAASLVPTGIPGASPGRLATDGDGGLFVAASTHVEHFPTAGGAATVAGDRLATGEVAAAGDGGPAADATFAKVRSLASDAAGNVYVADQVDGDAGTLAIRFVNRGDEPVTFYPGTPEEVTVAPGHITTIAGAPGPSQAGDGGPARAATFQGDPPALAVAGDRLYVASRVAAATPPTVGVRLINLGGQPLDAHGVEVAAGAVETVAGGGPEGYAGEGQLAGEARFGRLPGIAADDAGTLYLADHAHHRVRKVDPAGAVSTFAGTGPVATDAGGFNGNGRLATDARLDRPQDVAIGPDGRVFIADRGNGQLRVVDDAGLIHAAPGNGLAQTWTCEDDNGESLPAGMSRPLTGEPLSVATREGHVYAVFAGTGGSSSRVYHRDPSGRVALLMGGVDAAACPAEEDCPSGDVALSDAPLAEPVAVAADDHGGLYVLDGADGGRVWLANVGTHTLEAHGAAVAPDRVRIVATGLFEQDDDGPVGELRADGGALAADDHGSLYVADGRQVRRVGPDGDVATVVDRLDDEELDVLGSPPEQCCASPGGLALDEGGALYVSDAFGAQVWMVNLEDEPVTRHGVRLAPQQAEVVAGAATARPHRGRNPGDGGPGRDAELQKPAGLAVDPRGRLYLADSGEHTVRVLDPDGTIETVAGHGSPGFNGDGLRAGLTGLSVPAGLTIDTCGDLLVADAANQRLRRIDLGGSCADMVADSGSGGGWGKGQLIAASLALGVVAVAAGALIASVRGRRPSRP